MPQVTLNPTIDGTVNDFQAPRTWASVHGDTTCNAASTSAATDWGPYILGGSGSSQVIRSIFSFNLSSIPASATITAADLTLQVNSITDAVVDAYDYINVTAVTVATDGSIVTGDYGGFNANTTKFSTDKDLATMGTGLNTWSFNASGISYLQTQYNGAKYAQLSSREGHDIENQDPGASNNGIDVNYVDSASNKPSLVITYSLPGGSGTSRMMRGIGS